MSIVDKVKAFFDGLENDLHGVLGTHVAQDTIDAAKADVSNLVEQGKEQVAQLVAEAESDAKTDASTVAGDVKDLAAGQPPVAATVDNPQHQATDPANPAEPKAQATETAPAAEAPADPAPEATPTS